MGKKQNTDDYEQIRKINEMMERLRRNTRDMEPSVVNAILEKLKILMEERNQKLREQRRIEEERERKRREEEAALRSEEHILEVTSMDLPLDWENAFAGDSRTEGVHTDSISDGLILSLANLAKVDIEYISSITGEDCKTVINALRGSIYQNPDTWGECFYKGWETSEEYLSGNLIRKWNAAKAANDKYRGYFKDNLEAIEKVLPETVACKDIYATIGSPWIPTHIIDDFATHILRLRGIPYKGTRHDEYTGSWELPHKGRYCGRVASTDTFGTARLEALYILERTLNMKSVSVTEEVDCPNTKSGKKRVINQSETVLAIEKQQKMIAEFQRWLWRDEKRKEELEAIFEEKFSCVRRRLFDGSFLEFPTMSPDVTLYPYQKNAVARILFSPNTLLAHDVGSGKTYIMIAAGMEMRRMGLSEKNMYVVPNNIVGQWKSIFLTLYPTASLLCVEAKDFTPQKRDTTLRRMRDEDHDGIIIAGSCFERIPISKEYYSEELREAREKLKSIAADEARATAGVKKKQEDIDKKIAKLSNELDAAFGTVSFEELGVTRLFIDEAHNYKNVPLDTKTDRVLGISASGSKKCADVMDKVHIVQKSNNGGGVVMATGTPITNSITDAFIMQKYLQSGELAMLDLQTFDSWIGMFAEKVTEFEIDVDTNSYRLATRFSKFHNLPELTSLLASIADFHQTDPSADIPDFDGYDDALISRTEQFKDYLGKISERAERVRNGHVSRKDDNMLKITTDGRKAALDLRLVDSDATFTYQSKVARCAERVADIYRRTAADRSVQIVFCDSSTPKSGFNIYDEVKRLIMGYGVSEGDIAYIHDANTEAQREKLFRRVRNGEIRVLFGSTFKLGLGVNVQDRLIAIHHLDVPWRPADMTQREGRILRQGNKNEKVYIYRYITEGSFDAYSWQLLETKQRFITGLLSGSLVERSGSDIEGTVLDYAEVKALAVGNELVKKRVEVANELSRYLALQRKTVENHIRLEKEYMELPARISRQEELVRKCEEDLACHRASDRAYSKEERKSLRETLFLAVKNNVMADEERVFTTYRGFSIVLPANMTENVPYIWLANQGRYYVELGDTELGAMVRIDNFLERFEEHLDGMQSSLDGLRSRQADIETELSKKADYADMIEKLVTKLEEIDKKLGVKKK